MDGLRIRYHEAGSEHGGVPLVLMHGYNGSCDYWYPQTMPTLASARHVIAFDLPGNGLSQKLNSHTLGDYCGALLNFLDMLGLPKVDLLGHSMGGQLAIAAVAQSPHRFRRLVLMDSAGLPELVSRPLLLPFVALTDSSLRQVRMYRTFLKIGLQARAGRECLRLLRHSGVGDLLAAIRVPTLVLWGANDRVVPPAHGRHMARHIPGARLVMVHGAGHMPFYEKRKECRDEIFSFLSEDEGKAVEAAKRR